MVWQRCISPTSADQSLQRLRSATRGDLVVCSSATHFGARAFAVAGSKGHGTSCRRIYDHWDSWPLQDGIKDSSSLHPVTVTNCLTRRTLVMTLFMLRRVRNRRRYCYCYCYRTIKKHQITDNLSIQYQEQHRPKVNKYRFFIYYALYK